MSSAEDKPPQSGGVGMGLVIFSNIVAVLIGAAGTSLAAYYGYKTHDVGHQPKPEIIRIVEASKPHYELWGPNGSGSKSKDILIYKIDQQTGQTWQLLKRSDGDKKLYWAPLEN